MNRFGYGNPITSPQRSTVRTTAAPVKTIPFDYAFQFALAGTRGNKVQDVVEISTEGVFVALSVGYSMVLDEQKTPRTFSPVIDQNTAVQGLTAVQLMQNPDNDTVVNKLLIAGSPNIDIAVVLLNPVVIEGPGGVPFILKSGRIGPDGTLLLTLADGETLGRNNQFLIWDRTNNIFSQTYEVGSTDNDGPPATPVIGPDPVTRKMPAVGANSVSVYGTRNESVNLTILKGNNSAATERTATLATRFSFGTDASTFGSVIPLNNNLIAPGDLLIVGLSSPGTSDIRFSAFSIPRVNVSNISLGALAAGLEKVGVDLTRGLRLNPNFTDLFTADLPVDQIASARFSQAFEVGSVAAEEVSFLYSLDVGNTGREYQSEPIHNIAGLGIANGDRPFRAFTKPIMFEPRSFIRFQVEELSGPPGTLFIVLQGYKMLGTSRIPG